MRARVRALVVEDNAEMRFLLTQMLRQLQADQVDTASNVAGAKARLEYGDYDLVLVDVGLKNEDGINIVHDLRRDATHRLRSVPVLVVTGQNQLDVVKRALEAGADSFVAKPVSVLTLSDHVDRVLHHRRPLIECQNYFGPERRRTLNPKYAGPERRSSRSAGDVLL